MRYDGSVRALVVLSILAAGCHFDPNGLDRDGGHGIPPADAPSPIADAHVGDAGGGPDARPPDARPPDAPPPPLCDPTDPMLVGCWRFDGDAIDDSAYGNDGTTAGVSFVPGNDGAAMHPITDSVRVPDTASLAVSSAITIDVWLYAITLPIGGARMGIIDDDGQYGLFIRAGGEIFCTLAGVSSPASAFGGLPVAAWTHVTCVYDGATIRIIVNGALVVSNTAGGTINTTGSANGVAIGGNSPSGDLFNGWIDDLRVYGAAIY